ncbi:hypothetical protein GCM10010174_03450 [Kutzneria viridogrisea]|uniref:Exodeoxyribonuclease-3 n=1 Tax=Kutzneria viridogrisea TaxID=47990 RepID=A0ABR6BS26_9PSEU|nr:exodeoxyribonuclease-3 [Kutzneria viridogrisea]
MPLTALTLNIGAPSLDRARTQLRWLAGRPEDVLVLTETRATPGTALIAQALTNAGYQLAHPEHGPGDLGVLIASKVTAAIDPITAAMDCLPARLAGLAVNTAIGPVRVLGAYVPSRDATPDKTERKRAWITAFHQALDATACDAPVLLLGDLNVIEPGHQPAHRGQFAPFEYDFYRDLTDRHGLIDCYRRLHPDRVEHSWARRPELGYRYDHVHATTTLAGQVTACGYVHGTREHQADGTRLTDHSALAVTLAVEGTVPLLTSDPATAAGAEPEEFTLF